jgi:hypothetical protein
MSGWWVGVEVEMEGVVEGVAALGNLDLDD